MIALQAESRQLNRYDVLCLGTFWALSNSELDFLALSQRFVSIACNSAEMGNTSGPDSCSIKPKPLASLNHLTVPVVVDIVIILFIQE